jgi:hypothetical protein
MTVVNAEAAEDPSKLRPGGTCSRGAEELDMERIAIVEVDVRVAATHR